MVGLTVAALGAAVLLGVLTVSTQVRQRAEVRRSLRAIQGYRVEGVREQEMLESLGTRVLQPVSEGMVGLARRFTPAGYVESLKRKVLLAGSPPGFEVDRLLVLKILGAASGLVWVPLVYLVLGLGGAVALLLTGFLWAASFFGADVTLDRRVEARQHQIAVQLPDILDLLVISVEAGLGFEQAIDRTAHAVPGPLSDEFRRMLQETRIGATRADALRALEERTQVEELRSFILAMLQADTFGVSIARILRTQADEIRVRRRLAAEERAQRAPVAMLFPLVLCIFPAMFVVVLGPALVEISDKL